MSPTQAAMMRYPTMWFKLGDRVLVRSKSLRPSRQARSPVLGTVIEEPKSNRPLYYSVRIDHQKEIRIVEHHFLSPASIIDEVGRL